jgi:hypothetical protein
MKDKHIHIYIFQIHVNIQIDIEITWICKFYLSQLILIFRENQEWVSLFSSVF